MIASYGLCHLSLAVRDPDRSFSLYASAFGLKEYFRDDQQIQALGPGPHDVIAFERNAKLAGQHGGLTHFGFRMIHPGDVGRAVAEAQRAGGVLVRQGEFAPGYPFAYVADPDGYEIELWYE